MSIKTRPFLRDMEGRPVYPIGVNYWPRRTAVEMWSRWDPQGISRDLREIRSLGLNTIRFFLRTADFADSEGNLRLEAVEKLDYFLSLCRGLGLYVLPTLFVGHMSGMNFHIPWDRGEDFYTDAEALSRSRRFVQGLVARYRGEKAILGWILSNEITHYTGQREAHVLQGWIMEMYRTIRALDPHRPVGPGDGADDFKGVGMGFPEGTSEGIEDLKAGRDFLSLHHYYGDADPLRFSHAPAATVRLCDLGIPVLVEEFGVSTALWSETAQADYFRIVLFSTWATGAAGALAWCWSDFPTPDLPPYTHRPFELFFGITRADGTEKPAAEEMRRFARLMEEVGATEWYPLAPQAAVLVPSTFYVNYPFRQVDRSRLYKSLLEAYTMARMAGFEAIFIREPELPPQGVKLLLVPYGDLLGSTWRDLRAWVEAGGVLWSGFAGAVPDLEKLFGVRPARSLDALGSREREEKLRFLERLGDLAPGELIPLLARDSPRLPIAPTKARVLAVDGEDRPFLTVHRVGRGKAFFSSRPLEWLLADEGGSCPRAPVHLIYRALRTEAGISLPLEAGHPALSLSVLENERGEWVLIAINHGGTSLEGNVRAFFPLRHVWDIETGDELRGGEHGFRLELGPWGVRALKLER